MINYIYYIYIYRERQRDRENKEMDKVGARAEVGGYAIDDTFRAVTGTLRGLHVVQRSIDTCIQILFFFNFFLIL